MANNRPKIGIITFWNSQDNYGQLLQCYALQQALKNLNCEPFLIKYDGKREKIEIFRHILFLLLTFQWLRIFRAVVAKINKIETTDRGFDKFRNTYIQNSDKIYSISELKTNPPQADYYVCGSDQIWNGGYNKGFFLEWGKKNAPRISYSASFGKAVISNRLTYKIAKQLKKFKVVTVREQSGVDICKKAGIYNAFCVPDPTLLLTKQEYKKIMSPNAIIPRRNYIFVYWLGFDTANISFENIECFAKQKNLEIAYTLSGKKCKLRFTDKLIKVYPSIPEWLSLMANAKYVLTNSFHRTVFSIIFNRQFGTYLLQGENRGMNERIKTLFNKLNLTNRVIAGNLEKTLDAPIDYEKANELLNDDRTKIKNYFKQWFNL